MHATFEKVNTMQMIRGQRQAGILHIDSRRHKSEQEEEVGKAIKKSGLLVCLKLPAQLLYQGAGRAI